MQSVLIARMTNNRQAQGWLHKSTGTADTLIILCHGHNSSGERGRLITLARWFEHHGSDCIRWNAQRLSPKPNTFTVLTVSEEYEQVKAIVESKKRQYKRIIAVGHSQGAMLALKLCADGLAHVYVSLMGVGETRESLERKKKNLGVSASNATESEVTLPNGETFVYTPAFFNDFMQWDIVALEQQFHGPSLFIAASRDINIPPSEIEYAYDHAHEPKRLETIDDVHNFSDENARLIAHTIRDWLTMV